MKLVQSVKSNYDRIGIKTNKNARQLRSDQSRFELKYSKI